ncbi:MAG: hypothetical protein HWD59_11940 [Coxiellaceae bacterium]|nr:MAG: hypothetical protein HWD59_11940 [Coxiellaceae bacterium]
MSIKPRRRRKRRLAPGQSTAAEQAIDEVESDWKTALTRIAELAKMQYQLLLNAREHFTESKQAVNQQRIDLAKEFTNASEEQIKEQFQKFDTVTAPQQQIAAMGELGLTGANILHANRMHKILQGLDKAIAMVDKKLAEAEAFQARIQQLLAQNKVSADQVQQCEKQIIQLQKELEPLLGMASPSVTPAPSANTTPTPKPTPNRAKKQDEELAKEETKQETSTSRFAAKLKQLPTWIKEAVFNINSRKEEEEIAKATASPKMTGRR